MYDLDRWIYSETIWELRIEADSWYVEEVRSVPGGGTQRSAFSGSIRWNSPLLEPLTTA